MGQVTLWKAGDKLYEAILNPGPTQPQFHPRPQTTHILPALIGLSLGTLTTANKKLPDGSASHLLALVFSSVTVELHTCFSII